MFQCIRVDKGARTQCCVLRAFWARKSGGWWVTKYLVNIYTSPKINFLTHKNQPENPKNNLFKPFFRLRRAKINSIFKKITYFEKKTTVPPFHSLLD